jgi:endonuclease/exonuclease/phosphatase family metal-dependent hydrolase
MNDTDPDSTFGDLMGAAGFARVPYEGVSGMTSDFSKLLALDHVYVRGAKAVHVPGEFLPGSPWRPDALVGSDHIPLVFDLAMS